MCVCVCVCVLCIDVYIDVNIRMMNPYLSATHKAYLIAGIKLKVE